MQRYCSAIQHTEPQETLDALYLVPAESTALTSETSVPANIAHTDMLCVSGVWGGECGMANLAVWPAASYTRLTGAAGERCTHACSSSCSSCRAGVMTGLLTSGPYVL